MSVGASMTSESPSGLLGFFDLAVLVVAAPIMILIGVPAVGYAIGAGAWIVLRLGAVAVERVAEAAPAQRAVGIRLGFMLGRLFALAIAVILVRQSDGRSAALACLAVIAVGYTLSLVTSVLNRPRRTR